MSNELQVFNYTEQHQIRTTVIDGEPWFVAKDVCDVLGIQNIRQNVKSLDDDEKMTVSKTYGHSGQRGGAQFMTLVNEPGMYKLIFRSKKPEAKDFTRWVTHEVLPSIRKSGMYMSDQAADAYLHNPEEFAAMAARCSALERKVEAMERKLNERYSLSVLGETVLAQIGAISFKDGASFLSQHGVPIGQNRLFRYCRENKLLCSRKGRQWNKPTQKAIDAGLFNLQVSGGFNTITLITPRGLQYLTDELIAEKYPLLAMLEADNDE